MAAEPNSPQRAIEEEMQAVYRLYIGLAQFMAGDGLGGKLLYAGEPDSAGCRLLRAANIAGAASLAASADAAALREAMRAGALDFVVTSLDEALRILKNEIRKQQPVAVGVSVAPETLLHEMHERGVQPDLLAPKLPESPEVDAFIAHGALRIAESEALYNGVFHTMPIPADWKHPVAAFDELLMECVPVSDLVNRRWVQFAPRYLPRGARGLRSVVCDVAAVLNFIVRIGDARTDH